ncbi:Cache 3/Cache 2 fusion domain-containing protein, partial [bacterium]|nr:Cache 3/Cache 2 fusion domain-containing protein [bacterium]
MKNLKLSTKLLIYTISVNFFILALFIYFNANRVFNSQKKDAYSKASEMAFRYANEVKSQFEIPLSVAKEIAYIFKSFKDENKELSRDLVNQILKTSLDNNGDFLGVWSVWEANAIDSKDSEFKNILGSDQNGRFAPYWNRVGGIHLEACVDFDSTGETGEYYNRPKRLKKDVIMEPVVYPINGVDVMVVSFASPIINKNGDVLGVVGVDISMDKIREIISKIKPYNTGYAMLISNSGSFAAHPKTDILGKIIGDIDNNPKKDFIKSSIKNGKPFYLDKKAIGTSQETHISYAPFTVGDTASPWSIGVAIPMNIALQESYSTLWFMIFFGISIVLIIFIVLFIISLKIKNNILNITSICSNLIQSIEDGVLDKRENPNRVIIDFRSIILEINRLIDSFVKPINVTAEYVERISRGDTPPKITDDYKGDFNEIKNNLNSLIDANKTITDIAQKISDGDFSINIQERSGEDKLLISLRKSVETIKSVENSINQTIMEVQKGNLSFRTDLSMFLGGWKNLLNSVNGLSNSFENQIKTTTENIKKISSLINKISIGDVPKDIKESYEGEFESIKQSLNILIQATNQITDVAKKLSIGDTDVSLKKRGDKDEMISALINMIDNTKHDVENIIKMSKGDFNFKVIIMSEHDEMAKSCQNLQTVLKSLISDTEMLSNEAQNGNLDVRVDASKHQGDFRKIIDGMNNTLDNLIKPMMLTANYIDRISKGDIPSKITESYKGDFNEIKNNLNLLIDSEKLIENTTQNLSFGELDSLKIEKRSENDKILDSLKKSVDSIRFLVKGIKEYAKHSNSGELDKIDLDENRVEGAYREIFEQLNSAAKSTSEPIYEVLEIMKNL